MVWAHHPKLPLVSALASQSLCSSVTAQLLSVVFLCVAIYVSVYRYFPYSASTVFILLYPYILLSVCSCEDCPTFESYYSHSFIMIRIFLSYCEAGWELQWEESQVLLVDMHKCPWARYSTLNTSWCICQSISVCGSSPLIKHSIIRSEWMNQCSSK